MCLNGARTPDECAHVPTTPDELAAAAVDAVRAGAEDIHLHPKNADGADTMAPRHVEAALTAVRAAVPGVPVGVTTGAWTAPSAEQRVADIRAWTVLPGHASVNWHEDGAASVADALVAKGIGIEAGIFTGTDALDRFLGWPQAHRTLRVLAEVTDTDPRTAPQAAVGLLEALNAATDLPILLHGEDAAAWDILAMAASRRLDTRVGLEDVLYLPDGSPASSNAVLIRAARLILEHTRSDKDVR
ncbi:3-keto-5-aminohexanoate cleavage protein [Nocardia tenerifensis]|uniref:3-keto-5-aminohexanoate cleavage protein n=1 Tax=Nocardia tenerifensis TaxID=228006 RepID=UPI001FE4B4A5|nr:3-keto-5-aminohexanoate cleavage protein [Nocardia tenerifensis]